MEIKCDKCGHRWEYRGKTKWYLACPKCRNTININELTTNSRKKGEEG